MTLWPKMNCKCRHGLKPKRARKWPAESACKQKLEQKTANCVCRASAKLRQTTRRKGEVGLKSQFVDCLHKQCVFNIQWTDNKEDGARAGRQTGRYEIACTCSRSLLVWTKTYWRLLINENCIKNGGKWFFERCFNQSMEEGERPPDEHDSSRKWGRKMEKSEDPIRAND